MSTKKHPANKVIERLRKEYEGQSLAGSIVYALDITFSELATTDAVKEVEKEFEDAQEQVKKIASTLPEDDARRQQLHDALNAMESGHIQSKELAVEEMVNVLVGWYLKNHLGLAV